MVADYQIHLPEYLEQCINKDKPQLHCNGQCVLMKKIKEKEQEDAAKNMVVYAYSALYVHKDYTVLPTYHPEIIVDTTPFSPYLLDYRFTYDNTVFRPPIA